MYTCFDVANYFLKRQDVEVGDMMSNLKLQKLVYYAQGFYLAYTDQPLFPEPLMGWEHGPVCVPLYNKYKGYKSRALPIPESDDAINMFDPKTLMILNTVQKLYGQFAAWKLRNLSHMDFPWFMAYANRRAEIPKEEMRAYFKKKIASGNIIQDEPEPITWELGVNVHECNINLATPFGEKFLKRAEEIDKEFEELGFGPIDDESL